LGVNLGFLPQPSHSNQLIWTLLLINAIFMLQRILQRFIAVARIYGFWPAFISPLRIVYGNFINAHAFTVALLKFWSALRTGRRPVWSKTSNVFPTPQQLVRYHRRLGDLLLDSASVTPSQLQSALAQQAKEKKRLGAILIEEGIVSEERVTACIAKLYSMNIINLDNYLLKFSVSDLPSISPNIHQWLKKRRLVPIEEKSGKIFIALADPSDERLKKEVVRQLSTHKVHFLVAPSKQIENVLAIP
jgi:adsorption protein B